MGIENNTSRDLGDLREIRRSAESLKRNGGECTGILIAPLKLPHFLRQSIPSFETFVRCSEWELGLRPKISRRGWQVELDFKSRRSKKALQNRFLCRPAQSNSSLLMRCGAVPCCQSRLTHSWSSNRKKRKASATIRSASVESRSRKIFSSIAS